MTSLLIILITFLVIGVIGGAITLSTQKADADHAAMKARLATERMDAFLPLYEETRAASEQSIAKLVAIGNKQATAARQGNLREIERGLRPLTVREIETYMKQLPPPAETREMNYKLMVRTSPLPMAYDLAAYERSVVYRQLFFRKELLRVMTDQRASEQRDVHTPYYRPPDFRDYREQSVWVYDGVVVLTPLTIEEEYVDRKHDWQFGADVRPHLARCFGTALDQLDDRAIEEAFQRGVTMLRQEGLLKWR